MLLSEFLSGVSQTLADTRKLRWSDTELITYMNDGLRDIATRTLEWRQTDTFTLVSTQTDYTLSATPIKIVSVTATQNVEFTMIPPTTLRVTSPTNGVVVTINYAIVPATITNITTTLPFYHNTEDALRNYVIFRAYQKDATTENFAKANYFQQQYMDALAKNITGVESELTVPLYQSDFLIKIGTSNNPLWSY